MGKWPRDNQDDLIAFYGDPASSVSKNLVEVVPPFRMTYDGKPLSHVMFHKRAAPALERALKTIWDYYEHDQKLIDELGISKTAGTYNPRHIRGSTTKWSNHAYGAAIDINAEENGFNVEGNIPLPMIAAFKAEGARWGGDYRGGRKDPMHFEFCESGEPVRSFEQWLAFYNVKGGTALPPPVPAPAPKPALPKAITAAMRRRMMEIILTYEGRFTGGNLQVFTVDGQPEIGGITQKDHPAVYAKLKQLLDTGEQVKLKDAVLNYYADYTNPAEGWTSSAGLVFFLRDCMLNRGPTGAAEILQMALGVPIDHQIGVVTRAALAALDPNVAIDKLRVAREQYEDKHFDNGNGKKWRQSRGQWDGLVNRWNKAAIQAKAFQTEQGAGLAAEIITTTVVVVGGGGAAASTKKDPWTTADVAMAGGIVILVAFAAVLIIRWIKKR